MRQDCGQSWDAWRGPGRSSLARLVILLAVVLDRTPDLEQFLVSTADARIRLSIIYAPMRYVFSFLAPSSLHWSHLGNPFIL